jgi:hypothetical protein
MYFAKVAASLGKKDKDEDAPSDSKKVCSYNTKKLLLFIYFKYIILLIKYGKQVPSVIVEFNGN